MPLDELSRGRIDTFRGYIEESVSNDERYGAAHRHDREDESTLATRFEFGPSCWFEVTLRPMIPQIRVGFLTDDRSRSEEVEQAIKKSDGTIEQFVEIGFMEAGLDWKDPVVERYCEGEDYFYFSTPLALDELGDLDWPEVRNKTLRMLEGYLITFGPAIAVEEEEEEEEEEGYPG